MNSGSNLLIALGVFGVSIFGVELSNYSLVLLGISGAIISLSFLLLINKFFESSIYLIIFGLLFSYLTSGIINFLMSFGSEHQLKSYLLFSFGSFEKVLGVDLLIYSALILVGVLFIFRSAKNLNYLLLGENYAVSLGVDIRRYQRFLIFLVGIVSGVIGVYCGPIVFIGMMGPHLVRFMLNESNHKALVPLTFVAGSFLAVFSDVSGHTFFTRKIAVEYCYRTHWYSGSGVCFAKKCVEGKQCLSLSTQILATQGDRLFVTYLFHCLLSGYCCRW